MADREIRYPIAGCSRHVTWDFADISESTDQIRDDPSKKFMTWRPGPQKIPAGTSGCTLLSIVVMARTEKSCSE